MRRHLVIGVVIAIAAVIAYHFANSDQAPYVPATSGAPAGAVTPSTEPHLHVPTHATRLGSTEQRRALADRIAEAQAARVAHAAPAAPKLPESEGGHDLDQVSATALAALKEVIPFLADCYRAADRAHDGGVGKTAVASLTMRGDRDVGTLIDSDQLLDANQQPLDPELGTCIKTTLESLELPPLSEGDTIRMQYSFRFDDK